MKILNFGSCNIDYVYSLDHIVKAGETEKVVSIETFPGGKGLNQSVATAKAGVEVYHAGCVGKDGTNLIETLTDSNVNIEYLKQVETPNGCAIIQLSATGENSILIYSGSNEMITKEYADYVLENFGEGDILLLQNEISNVDYIAQIASQKKMCVILNPSPVNEMLEKIDFNTITYLILNEIEIQALAGADNTEKSLKILREKNPALKIVLTLGEHGCIFSDGTNEIYQPPYQVDVLDTTAAGDTFTGYFVAEISKGTAVENILKIASAASAIAISRKGAAPSIPEAKEVLSKMKTMTERVTNIKDISIQKAIDEYIDNHLTNVKLDELADVLGYSSVYTGSLVKKVTGMSFKKYVQKKRSEYAAGKLKNSDLPIENIISETGYENKNFFRKIFKEQYGKNPLEFRKGEQRK